MQILPLGHLTTNLQIALNTPPPPPQKKIRNEATQKKYLPPFLPKEITESKFSNAKKILSIILVTWIPEYSPGENGLSKAPSLIRMIVKSVFNEYCAIFHLNFNAQEWCMHFRILRCQRFQCPWRINFVLYIEHISHLHVVFRSNRFSWLLRNEFHLKTMNLKSLFKAGLHDSTQSLTVKSSLNIAPTTTY